MIISSASGAEQCRAAETTEFTSGTTDTTTTVATDTVEPEGGSGEFVTYCNATIWLRAFFLESSWSRR